MFHLLFSKMFHLLYFNKSRVVYDFVQNWFFRLSARPLSCYCMFNSVARFSVSMLWKILCVLLYMWQLIQRLWLETCTSSRSRFSFALFRRLWSIHFDKSVAFSSVIQDKFYFQQLSNGLLRNRHAPIEGRAYVSISFYNFKFLIQSKK